MEATINDIKNHKIVKDLQRGADLILMNKKEMYNALLAVQEYFNRIPDSKFSGKKPHELDMVEKMNELGFIIK